jgi:PAS domain S-box-containing protein
MGPETRAIVFADPEGRIRYWSPAAERLLGHAAADALGRSLDLLVPPEYRERHWAGFARAMQSGECRLDRAAAHLPVVCGDGAVRVFPARFVFVADAHGRAAGALAIYGEAADGVAPWTPVAEAARAGARGA